MIARISILIVLLTILPDAYIYCRYIRRRFAAMAWLRMLWWLPCLAMLASTAALSLTRDFAPANIMWLNIYLFMLGLVVVPKALFALCSLAGRGVRRLTGGSRNWGNYVGLVAVLAQMYVLFTGSMAGVDHLAMRHLTLEFADLPASFDGYRIVQWSDAHLGSMRTDLLKQAVAATNDAKPDIVVFTGDIQNTRPQELVRFGQWLVHLHPSDGIFSVLGNHDYSDYVKLPADAKLRNERMTRAFEESIGWDLLLNERRILRRGQDSIVIAGEENGGLPPFPNRADLKKTLHGISPRSFVVMLQHDPSAWRRSILPGCNAQLTLSGHTHGGQFSLFGMRPTRFKYSEDAGLYRQGARCLYVSTGLGGVVPFRFHMDPEVVVITLKKKVNNN